MRKKLVILALVLAATAAATAPATVSASPCPPKTAPLNCGTYIVCCPYTALCFC
jgi:hypothetical protein